MLTVQRGVKTSAKKCSLLTRVRANLTSAILRVTCFELKLLRLCSYSALYAFSGPFAANRINTLQPRRCCLWCQAVTVARHLCLLRGGFVPASYA